jgi:aminopeptidase
MEDDPRLAAYARLLIDRCIDPQPGWQVLVQTTTLARPLARELSRLLAERGAYALTRLSFGAPWPIDLDWIEAAPAELAPLLPPLEQELVDRVDASICVVAPEPDRQPATPEARRAMGAHLLAYRARGRRGEIPHVRCDLACEAFARAAGMDLPAYNDLFYDACLRDWDSEGERMRPVLERFDGADEVRIVGEGTDLRLSLAGRAGAIDDGHLNVPGGEVFYSPVEDSLEGVIAFDVPGVGFEGIRLEFRGGEVVEASATQGEDRLLAALETDDGARRVGEFGVGCNDGITRPTRNVLFDEKMAGTVHLALGDGFPQLGGSNRSALHWDLIKDLRSGGELWADGDLVQGDGVWR